MRLTAEDTDIQQQKNIKGPMANQELKPYSEQFCDNMNPHVTEVMMNMGFEWNQMLNSLRNKS